VWRARIIVLSADGNGTIAIARAVGKDKTVVWRWQERFMHEESTGSALANPAAAGRDRRS
jgi:hypothetical protein